MRIESSMNKIQSMQHSDSMHNSHHKQATNNSVEVKNDSFEKTSKEEQLKIYNSQGKLK